MPRSTPRARTPTKPRAASTLRFAATILRPSSSSNTRAPASAPGGAGDGERGGRGWTFLTLPDSASAKLPSRGMVSITGAINAVPFRATLQPDGRGGHWLKIDPALRRAIRAATGAPALKPGDSVTLEIAPVPTDQEPEPIVPPELRKALAAATKKARDAWSDITPVARRDFIHWITSAKHAETRARRIVNACDMLAKGKRRPCCFDRSGMYGKSLSRPTGDRA